MANVGTFKKSQSGILVGNLRTLQMNLPDVQVAKIEGAKRGNNSPDYRVFVEGVELGAGWLKPYEGGKKKFISAMIDDPSLPAPFNFSLFEQQDGSYNASWNRPQQR